MEIDFTDTIFEGSRFSEIKLTDEKNQSIDVDVQLMNNKLKVLPNVKLMYRCWYNLIIPNGALKHGNGIENNETSYSFKTEQKDKGTYINWREVKNVPVDKIQATKFNDIINKKEVVKHIKLYDKNLNEIEFNIELNKDCIRIIPKEEYKKGYIYYLQIENGIEYFKGKHLNKKTIMKFTAKSFAINRNFNF